MIILLIPLPLGFIFYYCNPEVIFVCFIVNYRVLFFYLIRCSRCVFLADRILKLELVFIFLGFPVLLIVVGSEHCLTDMSQGLFHNLLLFLLVYSFSVSNLLFIIIVTILIHQLLIFNLTKLLITHLNKLIKLLYRLLFSNLLVLVYQVFLLIFVLF